VPADESAGLLQGEPGDVLPGGDGCLAEGLEHERLPGSARYPRFQLVIGMFVQVILMLRLM
jgi:hypothetical protein